MKGRAEASHDSTCRNTDKVAETANAPVEVLPNCICGDKIV